MGEYAFVICCAFGVSFGAGTILFMLLMGAERGPNAPPVRLFVSPYNIIFTPHLLTEKGRRYRRWCLLCMSGFFACWVLGVLIGLRVYGIRTVR